MEKDELVRLIDGDHRASVHGDSKAVREIFNSRSGTGTFSAFIKLDMTRVRGAPISLLTPD